MGRQYRIQARVNGRLIQSEKFIGVVNLDKSIADDKIQMTSRRIFYRGKKLFSSFFKCEHIHET
jgi:hypothetical protein